MKKILLFLVLFLFGINNISAQCWKSISTGGSHTLALRSDGTLWGWGTNSEYRLGGATSSSSSNIPIQIGTDTDWNFICASSYVSFAIKTDGTMWGWGTNPAYYGSLPLFVTVPTQIGVSSDWKMVSSNFQHHLAIKTDGTLWSWCPSNGGNQNGELGNGTTNPNNIPTQVGTDTNWASVSAGTLYSLALKTDGTLWAWGEDTYGALGTAPASPGTYYSPVKIGAATDWVSISAGYRHSHAIKSDGSLWSWGINDNGQLGDGTLTNKNSPVRIGTDNDWKMVTGRGQSTFAIKNNGNLYAWGDNLNGTLGDGSNIDRLIPVHISPGTAWKNISGQFLFTVGFKQDNTIVATGHNVPFPYLGNGTSVNSNVFTLVTTSCPPMIPIIANDDSGTALNGIANTAIANVLTNDTFNGNPATFSNVTLSFISATHSGITLNTTTGAVNVSAAVPVGTYTLNYQICQIATLNCDTATVTITVNPQTIDAVNDNFSSTPIDYLTGGITPSLLTNDTVNGSAANPTDVILTLTNNGGIAGATINVNGEIDVPVATPINTYTLQYSICLASNPSICDTATVTVTVADRVITTPEIAFAIRANNAVDKSELQSTGKIIISGGFTKYNNVDAKHLMRLNTDLTHDTSFLALGSLPYEPEDFKVLSNDKIIAVGTFTSINGVPTARGIARLNADGTVDTSFNVGGTGLSIGSDRIMSCAVQSDGKILLGGGFIRSYNGIPTRNMIRLNSDGTLDTSFVYPYTHTPSTMGSVHKMVVQPDGKILVTGNNSRSVDALGNANGQPHIFRLNSDGSLDSTFTTTFLDVRHRDDNVCSTCINPVQNMVLQPDGKIIVVGAFVSFHDVRRKNHIVRLNSDGTLDTTFQTNPLSTTSNRAVKDAVVEPSGKIIIGGEFTTYSGATANKLVRLNANGTVDATFSSGGGPTHPINYSGGTVYDLNRQADGKVIVSGSFSHYNTISATNITRIAPEIPGSQARGNGIQLWNTEKEIENSFHATGEINIYPNPSTGIFTFDLTQTKEKFAMITIYNALGQKVYQKNSIPESVNEVDLSNLPSGYYYAQITSGNSNVQKVLMKK